MKMKNPNEEHSSIKQALLDLKASGGDANAIDILIRQIGVQKNILADADELFRKRMYPNSVLKWLKLHSDIEFTRFLSPNALMILIVMCQNMLHGNLLQINYRELMEITNIKSIKYIKPALDELIHTGCIMVRIPGTTRRSAVYMINPEIATIGKDSPGLTYIFWKQVRQYNIEKGIDKENEEEIEKNFEIDLLKKPESSTLTNWEKLTKERTYSKGTDHLEEDSHKVFFGKINEPKIKRKSKKGVDEDLPFN